MYLKALKMTNFRKFRTDNNVIEFADAETYESRSKEDGEINVASTVTLIVGKNNAGKTTVIEALKRLINSRDKWGVNDFNIGYLAELAERYNNGDFRKTPFIEFEIVIGMDKGEDDYLNNLAQFFSIGSVEETEVSIIAKYEVTETSVFCDNVKNVFDKRKAKLGGKFVPFGELFNVIEDNKSYFRVNYYDKDGIVVKDFKIEQLIELVSIMVTGVESGTALSQAFNKIVKYRYKDTLIAEKEKVDDELETINETLTNNIKTNHTIDINKSLDRVISGNSIEIFLGANITFDKLMDSLIRYEYIENGNHIPESQFGLGYSNLMMIIASIIDYIEKRPDTSFNSKINLISIEEPETHMHPQMQELFIQYINDAINVLLESKDKHVNSQIIITTHSSHVLNSKVQTGGSFNNINYITEKDGQSCAIPLTDEIITPNAISGKPGLELQQFEFIKKHIKFGISDALFADAVILVEGLTEETLIPYYLGQNENLRHRYIKLVKIDGAHAFVYDNFFRTLGIPVAIVTDLDILRTDDEKANYTAINDLTSRKTTNLTLAHYLGKDDIDGITMPLMADNIAIFFQNQFEGLYRTSFEEAFIAKNKNNEMVNSVLKEMKPKIHLDIVGNPENRDNNSLEAYKWQRKLADSKGEFATSLLFKIFTETGDIPEMPQYIVDALKYIETNI